MKLSEQRTEYRSHPLNRIYAVSIRCALGKKSAHDINASKRNKVLPSWRLSWVEKETKNKSTNKMKVVTDTIKGQTLNETIKGGTGLALPPLRAGFLRR